MAVSMNGLDLGMNLDVRYVERCVNYKSIPILHAWLSINEKLVDVILKNIGRIPDEWRYLGVKIPLEQTLNVPYRGVRISLLDDWEWKMATLATNWYFKY